MARDAIDSVPSAHLKARGPAGRAAAGAALAEAVAVDSRLDSALSDPAGVHPRSFAIWVGWRRRMLLLAALVGIVGILELASTMASTASIDAVWRLDSAGRIDLAASRDPALQALRGKTLAGVVGPSGVTLPAAVVDLQRSPRWIVGDAERALQQALYEQASTVIADERVRLVFADGSLAELRAAPRGWRGLPLSFWLLALVALALYLMAVGVGLAQPSSRTLAYAAMALCQCGNFVFMAVEAASGFGMPAGFAQSDLSARMAFDLFTGAALVNAACLHPRRLPGSGWVALACWGLAMTLVGGCNAGWLVEAWWWTQGTVIGLGLTAIALLSWSYQIERHPLAIVLRRVTVVAIATWALLTLAVAGAASVPDMAPHMTVSSAVVWYSAFALLLMLVPFLAKAQNFMRELALLAAVSTVATSLDLLFVSVLALGHLAALILSLLVSLLTYAGVRQWFLNQLAGGSMLGTERIFEQLYRIAREIEAEPGRAPALLSQLLNDLFEPLEVRVVERRAAKTRVARDGSGMLVPMPLLGGELAPPGAVILRYAQRGRRMFTSDDARLADRVVEQLRRALHFDKAVEQGRSEERMRLAQDLHDDIGARLLTLMYKAQSPEMEDYVRHTLQDLKTLTRGLAAPNQRLSHAAAEWKADLTHRLSAAHVALGWSVAYDEDIVLSVGHWSALTRVLRELVSNAIAHAHAQQVDIDLRLDNDRMELTVTDDGIGRDPSAWSHGLGLGGVRKRVKQLGGEVEWREVAPRGISCRVVIRDLSTH